MFGDRRRTIIISLGLFVKWKMMDSSLISVFHITKGREGIVSIPSLPHHSLRKYITGLILMAKMTLYKMVRMVMANTTSSGTNMSRIDILI